MTSTQKRQIACYLHFEGRDMSLVGLVWFNWRIHAIIAAVAIASIGFAYLWLGTLETAIAATAYAALFLRDMGHYGRSVAVWPVVRELLDWDKVHAMRNPAGPDFKSQIGA